MNTRLTTAGGIYAWEKDDREITVRVDGLLTFSVIPVLNAALDGHGLAYVPERFGKPCLDDGRLKEVLADWCPCRQLHVVILAVASIALGAAVEGAEGFVSA